MRRYRVVRQADRSDCGAAALATVALHHGRPLSLQAVRDLAGTDRSGADLQRLARAAARLGLTARGAHGTYAALPSVQLPAIAHVARADGTGHFVVVFAVRRGGVVIGDPASGVERISREAFCARWSGYLLLVDPDPAAVPVAAASRPASPWCRFAALLAVHRGVLVEAFFCALLMTLLGVSTSYFIQHLVDAVLVRGETKLLDAFGAGMLAVVVFRTVFGVLRRFLLAHVGRKVDLSLVAGYARHLLDLPARFFETRRTGEILSRIHDAEKVREAISGTTLTAVTDAVMVVATLGVLWAYDAPLALAATLFVPLMIGSVAAHHAAGKRRSRAAMEHAAQLSAHLVENVHGVETIKALGMQRRRSEEGEERLVDLVQSGFSLQKIGISIEAVATLLSGVAGVAVLWSGGHRVVEGALTIGQLMFFYTLLGSMLEPLRRLAGTNLEIQEALVAVHRLYEVLDLPPEQTGPERAAFGGVREAIELRDVSFSYGSRAVLDGLSLRLPAGATVAIVGESGSGKSTLLELLQRFHDPDQGQVLLDGVDARDLDLASLRAKIGVVSQEPMLFRGTIRENIALGRPGAALEDVIAAARAAGMHDFVSAQPERYETIVGERGANLSGGQRQRLAIARALLRDPDILLLDEATSHLDSATERAIQSSLESAFAGKTVVVVAHRLSTIRRADLICVLRQGRIEQQGTHRDLIAGEGWYRDLWLSQVGGRSGVPAGAPLAQGAGA